MPAPVVIKDGTGTARKAEVNTDNALKISEIPFRASQLPHDILTLKKQYQSYFADKNGNINLNVNASLASPQDFYIASTGGTNLFITGFRIIFHSSSMNLGSNNFKIFGSISSELTNGITCFATQSGIITNIFSAPIKFVGDFLTYANNYTNFVSAISSGVDYLNFDFVFDVPIVIPQGVTDNLTVRVQDNLTSLQFFQVIARGYQELDI